MIKSILGGKSKNLFDISKADVVIHSDMSFSSNVSYNSHFYSIPVEAGQAYTVSYDIYAVDGGGLQMALSCQTGDFYQDGVSLFIQLTPENSINNWNHITNTFTIPSGATKITFSSLKYPDYPKYFRNFQIELGSTATEYVPHELTSYKSIMKVSDVCQLVDKSKIPTTRTISGVTFTNNGDGSVTVDGTSTHQYYSEIVIPIDGSLFIPGHVYLNGTIAGDFAGFVALYGPVAKDYIMAPQHIYTLPSGKDFNKFRYIIRVNKGVTANNYKCIPQPFDLTKMFGAGNEPKTVAEFKAKFPNDYYPYSPSCFVTSFDERMPCKTKNLFSSSTEVGIPSSTGFDRSEKRLMEDGKWYIGLTGSNYYSRETVHDYSIMENSVYVKWGSNGYSVAKCIYCEPNTTYSFTMKYSLIHGHSLGVNVGFYTEDGTFISFKGETASPRFVFTTPENCKYITICLSGTKFPNDNFGAGCFSDLQLVKGTTATDYVPHDYI